ncbi:EAL domain-containing protein [uncultured Paraglaciecola sp.]|uniref:EAL domain-containing protein n=1 Tax=uncultured Paraglaciecola sp. TaxID=1765024 RepID=UPI00345B6B8A
MYHVKHLDSNEVHYQFYEEKMLVNSQRTLEVQQHLRNAIAENELYLVLQPQFSLDDSQALCGAEVLLRWQSKKLGLVSPAEFIPIAEKSGLILTISAWVLEQSCRLIKQLQEQFSNFPRVSVNLSGDEISVGLAKRINTQLTAFGLSSQSIMLEITEAQLVKFNDQVTSEIDQLRRQGVRISLDDFGTGYSSMSYLSSLRFDEIKIDRTFITKISTDKKILLLVKAIVSMAQALECKIVVEGVETTEELDCLTNMGIDVLQGYLFGKPMPCEKLVAHLNSGKYKILESSFNI